MSDEDDRNDINSGYKRPPKATRYAKGQSGNPSGRPPGRYNEAPYEAVLGQIVTIREDGVDRKVTAAEAFLLQLAKRGLEGDMAAAGAAHNLIAQKESAQKAAQSGPQEFTLNIFRPGSVTLALEPLRMGKKLDPHRPTVRVVLEPWLVEAALARLGDRRFTPSEQKTVLNATRTPKKVRWPSWWEVLP